MTIMASVAPLPVRGEYRSEKNLKLEPGGHFVIDSGVGNIRVIGSSTSGARIAISSNYEDLEGLFSLFIDSSGAVVQLVMRRRQNVIWPGYIFVDFAVMVPHETGVELTSSGGMDIQQLRRDARLIAYGGSITVADLKGNLDAQAYGGNVSLRRITGNAKLRTHGGNIDAHSVGGWVDARTSGGAIQVDGVRGRALVRTAGGSIRISDAGDQVDARSSGGNLEMNFAKGNLKGGFAETSGGAARVVVDGSVSLSLNVSSSSGQISTNLPIQVSGVISTSCLLGTLNSGGEMLTVRSGGGPIRIESATLPS
jgi:DUF4097 and DUF4098 domain-containing protein YvlB